MVTLIVVLAGISLSTYSTSVARAKEAVLRENLFRMRDSIDQFYADKGMYPPDLTSLVTEGYMRQIPKDPFTESADTWQVVMSEPDPASPKCRARCVRREERRRRRQPRRDAVRGPAIAGVKSARASVCRSRKGCTAVTMELEC